MEEKLIVNKQKFTTNSHAINTTRNNKKELFRLK